MTMLLQLCLKEWRALRRDWHGLLVLFVMPAAFILIMSLALRDTYQSGLSERLAWTWIDDVHGDAAEALLGHLGGERGTASADRAAMFATLQQGRAAIGLELRRVPGEQGADPAVVVHARPGTHAPLVAEFAARVRQAWLAAEIDQLRSALPPGSLPPSLEDTGDAAITEVRFAQADGGAASAVQQSVPAWLIFSMFFVVIPCLSRSVRTARWPACACCSCRPRCCWRERSCRSTWWACCRRR
jgi:ABC-2 type transport system permease protein